MPLLQRIDEMCAEEITGGFSGDHGDAKAEVAALTAQLGFASIDLGGLEVGGYLQQFPGGPLPAVNLLKLG